MESQLRSPALMDSKWTPIESNDRVLPVNGSSVTGSRLPSSTTSKEAKAQRGQIATIAYTQFHKGCQFYLVPQRRRCSGSSLMLFYHRLYR